MDIKEITKIIEYNISDEIKEVLIIEHISKHERAFNTIKLIFEDQVNTAKAGFKESVELLDLINRTKDIVKTTEFNEKINTLIDTYKTLYNNKPKLP